MAQGDLITLAEYMTATGQLLTDTSTPDQNQISWQIAAASDAVRAYTDRDFTLQMDAVAGPRTYRYDGHGGLEIDDASGINSVALAANTYYPGRTLDPTEWFAFAAGNPDGILDSLEIYSNFTGGMSPEMGFRNNLDRIGYAPYPPMMTVDAAWGWPFIPPKVKRAVVLTVADAVNDDDDEYTAESIAGFSRSRTTSRSVQVVIQSLPGKAIALLDSYVRLNV